MDIVEHYDKRFGVIAVEKGFISEDKVVEALRVQVAEDISIGEHRLIGRILVEHGHITLSQLDDVLQSLDQIAA